MSNTASAEYEAFTNLVDRVLSVPHSEIQKRVEAHRRGCEESKSAPPP
jgi:hypothetical protein